ncbi:MAG: PAS domain S-box protein [Nitrospirae bacterium]|nr:MAG: PAS domain S-box protein [Nitrospirota bacterium]
MAQHSLLKRQLKRLLGDAEPIPKHWQAFIDAVDQAYLAADADRKVLERSLDLSSHELLQANSEMRAVVQAFPDIFFLLDTQGTILSYKGGTSTDFYLSPEQLLGKRLQDVPLANAGTQFEHAIREVQVRNAIVSVEYALTARNRTDYYEARLAPLPNQQILMIVRNISERKQAEIALRNAHGELEYRVADRTTDLLRANEALRDQITQRKRAEAERDRFFAVSVDLLCVAGFDGSWKHLNPAWEKTLGWTIAELRARPYHEFIHPDDQAATIAAMRKLAEGSPTISFENRYQCKDGSYRWFQWNAAPFPEQRLIYATARDVTEHRQLEEQLRQAQKMEAIGKLAGGIAHDFNNILTVITGHSQMLLETLDRSDPQREHVQEIQEAGDRATALTNQLLTFSRRQVVQPKVLDLNAIVGHIEGMLRRLIGEDIHLATKLIQEPAFVKVDPGQIEQVIVNLAVNARDAMPQGGRLAIETSTVELDQPPIHAHGVAQAGPYVMLTISDTGQGMDATTQARIFEPFFTTKEQGKGTGLGLSTVYGIVSQSSGSIVVHSEPGRGTTFKIYLPRIRQETLDIAPTSVVTQPPHGSESILLVEDEEKVRMLVAAVLRRKGFTVQTARDGAEALKTLEAHTGPLHLLLTDMVMPGMNGRELAEQVTRRHPTIKVLYMSGYTDDATVRHGALDASTPFLQKPFPPDVLVRKLRELLDA